MYSSLVPPNGDSVVITELLEQLRDNCYHNLLLLCRLQDVIAPTDQIGETLSTPAAAHPAATMPLRPQVSIYEEAITPVLTDAEHRLIFQPLHEGVLSRGHDCCQEDGATVSQKDAPGGTD